MASVWGRFVLAAGAVLYGGVDLLWPAAGGWLRLLAAVELAGGVALLWPRGQSVVARAGAAALTAAYLMLTALTLPEIVRHPAVFNSWGNAGEELARLAGAALLLAMLWPAARRLAQPAYWAFAVCVFLFALEQWVYFAPTVALVPAWLPPGQVFWAIATTLAFGLAATALLTGRMALIAARLLTAMLLGFGVLVWVPILVQHSHVHGNWTEFAETLSIAGAAWVVSDSLDDAKTRAVR